MVTGVSLSRGGFPPCTPADPAWAEAGPPLPGPRVALAQVTRRRLCFSPQPFSTAGAPRSLSTTSSQSRSRIHYRTKGPSGEVEENLFGTVKVTLARALGAAAARVARDKVSRGVETGGFREPPAEPSGLVWPGMLTPSTRHAREWRRGPT